jgi:hypothetical protein
LCQKWTARKKIRVDGKYEIYRDHRWCRSRKIRNWGFQIVVPFSTPDSSNMHCAYPASSMDIPTLPELK